MSFAMIKLIASKEIEAEEANEDKSFRDRLDAKIDRLPWMRRERRAHEGDMITTYRSRYQSRSPKNLLAKLSSAEGGPGRT